MKQKHLLYFSAFVAVIALFSLLSDFILLLVHGFSRSVFEGYSTGKTILMLSWFFFLPLLSFVFLKFNLSEKIKSYSKKLLLVFLIACFVGYGLGALQFSLFSFDYDSLGPFATITENGEVMNWEASKIAHNHFPKASLYFLTSSLGLDFKGRFDDGFPWYSFIPDADVWAVLYLLIELVILISGILFINSKIKDISFFDYLVFLAGLLAVIISVLDGGIGSGAAMMVIFFFTLFFSRNYLKTENHVFATLLPLLVIGFVGFADVVLPFEIGNLYYASSYILFFGLIYYFLTEKKMNKLKWNSLNLVLALIFVVSIFISAAQYLDFSFGREIQPSYLIYDFEDKSKGAGVFVYGLPSELDKEKVDLEVSKFGEIIESDKANWSYYALIHPKRNFRTGDLEVLLQKKFSNGSYLYVEQASPLKKIMAYKILWFTENIDSNKLLRDEFLASRIIQRTDNFEENSTEIIVEQKVDYIWQMNSILSEIRSNGFKGKILLIKKS